MIRRIFLFGFVCVVFSSCSWFDFSRSKITVADLEHPFVSLFNGDDLNGWVVMGNPQGWQVVEGVIHSDGGKGGNWLRSEKEYENFSLVLEYKISPGGDSGVFLRCAAEGNPGETGLECQISSEQPPRDEIESTGSLYGYVPASPRPDESPDVWHTFEILCKNKRILVLVDGRKTVDINEENVPAIQNKPMKGYIGLQDSHAKEGQSVEFRNIRIRELL